MTRDDLARATQALAAEGFADLKPARVVLSRRGANTVAAGGGDPVRARLVAAGTLGHAADAGGDAPLQHALAAARARGAALQDALLAGPDMLSTAGMAGRLGMSEEGIRLKRKRHEVLGLAFAKRGIRYPSWQVLADRQLLPALPRLFAILGDEPWRLYRFLLQHHAELGGGRALEALQRGRCDSVLAAAENSAAGAFA